MPALGVGWRVPDPVGDLDGYLAHVVLAAVLTDGAASRLQQRMVQREALVTEVRAKHPDAVVTDNEMPEMTGLQARAELLTTPDTADIPVVMATGSVTSEEAAETLQEGDRIVRKPFRPAELRDNWLSGGGGGSYDNIGEHEACLGLFMN